MNSNIIYDVGMNRGDDTAYYLHRGFNVVAIEAAPNLVEKGKERFKDYIENERLKILCLGIAEKESYLDFWICENNSIWNSFDKSIASRDNRPHHSLKVKCVPFRKILEEYGIPYYLKVDIEGNDIYCIKDIRKDSRPQFISVEMTSLELLNCLEDLGYRWFKLIDQSNFLPMTLPISINQRIYRLANSQSIQARLLRKLVNANQLKQFSTRYLNQINWEFSLRSSGPFGEDIPGKWYSRKEIEKCWLFYLEKFQEKPKNYLRAKKPEIWCDLHAKKC